MSDALVGVVGVSFFALALSFILKSSPRVKNTDLLGLIWNRAGLQLASLHGIELQNTSVIVRRVSIDGKAVQSLLHDLGRVLVPWP